MSVIVQRQGQLCLAFLRIGLLGFGGGPSMIPLIHAEAVNRYGWMSDEEFADVLAIGNTLPGPIATKMAGTIGHRVGGIIGVINATFTVMLPCIFAMVALLGIYMNHRDERWISGMGEGVVPVVMVMMIQLTWNFWEKSRKTLGWLISSAMIFVSAGLIYGLGISPGVVIGILLCAALMRPDRKRSQTSSSDGPKE